MSVSTKFYKDLHFAFDFFNGHLFNNELIPCMISIRAKSTTMGYFSAKRFNGTFQDKKSEKNFIHEIALNPLILNETNELIFSTLVHEMVHLWQEEYGKPTKNYHNKEFAAKMKSIGLHPSDTGKPGGKETGHHMSDYPVKGGPFLKAMQKITKEKNFDFCWEIEQNKKSTNNKIKFTCSRCGQNAWGKDTLKISCLLCDKEMKKFHNS